MGSIVAEIAEKLSADAAGTSQTGTLTIGEGDLVLGSTAVSSTAATEAFVPPLSPGRFAVETDGIL